jgi:NAD(P)H-nitrite reductase large subunit
MEMQLDRKAGEMLKADLEKQGMKIELQANSKESLIPTAITTKSVSITRPSANLIASTSLSPMISLEMSIEVLL